MSSYGSRAATAPTGALLRGRRAPARNLETRRKVGPRRGRGESREPWGPRLGRVGLRGVDFLGRQGALHTIGRWRFLSRRLLSHSTPQLSFDVKVPLGGGPEGRTYPQQEGV